MKPSRQIANGRDNGALVRLQKCDLALATALGSAIYTLILSFTSYFLLGISPPSFPILFNLL